MASATASNEMGPEMAMVSHKALDEWKAATARNANILRATRGRRKG